MKPWPYALRTQVNVNLSEHDYACAQALNFNHVWPGLCCRETETEALC